MNYGLYLSANGALSSMHRQDVLANNLANVETVGFKPDRVTDQQRLVERLESALPADPQLMLERLGGGHFVAATLVDLAQGPLERSGNPLDVAIEGEGLLAVAASDGEVRLTRDGRFTLDARGTLVSVVSGRAVLDVDGQPIRLDRTTPIQIDADGVIRQDGGVVAQLRLLAAPADALEKDVGTLLRYRDGTPASPPTGSGRVRQGYVEASAVDPIMTLNALTSAAKAVQANGKLMQYHDFVMGQAISTFGRVA